MPRAHTTKFKDEHHIFVKNVPADLGIAAVPRLFEQYKPTRIKNVYPTSNITTIVVTFATYEEAEQAKEDIDGIRLDNVVLRVEMYDKRRSLRYLKETRTTHRPRLGYVEEEYDDDYEEEEEEPEVPVYVRPSGTPRQGSPGITTWAGIVGNDHCTGMAPLSALAHAVQTEYPTPVNEGHRAKQTIEQLPSHVDDGVPLSEHGSLDVLPPSTETTSTTDSEPKRKTGKQLLCIRSPGTFKRTSIFVPWESFDSTERIVQRHCRDCAFCKKRLA